MALKNDIVRNGLGAAIGMLWICGGCAPEQEALIIRAVPIWPEDGSCAASTETGKLLPFGRLDLSFDTAYMQSMVLQNNLVPGGGPTSGNNMTDDSEIQLSAVTVSLDMPQDPQIIDTVAAINPALVEFRVGLSSASLGGQQLMGILVDVIPRSTADALGQTILAKYGPEVALTVYTKTVVHALRSSNASLNDSQDHPDWSNFFEIDSRQYSFPIELCFNCLRYCPTNPGNTAREVALGLCGNAQDLVTTPAGCATPQDE